MDSDLLKRLGKLQSPRVRADATRSAIKLAVLSAQASSRIGIALVAVPCLFVLGVVLHYGAGVPVPGFQSAELALRWLELHARIVPPLLLAGAPLLAIVLNLLAVVHVSIDNGNGELHVVIRLRWLNLAIIAVSGLIVLVVFAHLVGERLNHLH